MRKTRTTNSRNNEADSDGFTSDVSRRDVLPGGAAVLLTTAVPSAAAELTNPNASFTTLRRHEHGHDYDERWRHHIL